MNTLLSLFFSPVRAFNNWKLSNTTTTFNAIVILLLMLINLILMIPINAQIAIITFTSADIPDYQIDSMIQVSYKMRYLQVVGYEILYIIMFVFYSCILRLIVRLGGKFISFKKAFQLIVSSYLIIVVGDLINTFLLYIRGVDSIKNIYDTSLVSANLFTSIEQVGTVIYSLLSYVSPFQLYFVVLIGLGLSILTDMKKKKAFMISFLFWIITILIPVLSVYYSQAS